jgi:hypothetical protein
MKDIAGLDLDISVILRDCETQTLVPVTKAMMTMKIVVAVSIITFSEAGFHCSKIVCSQWSGLSGGFGSRSNNDRSV